MRMGVSARSARARGRDRRAGDGGMGRVGRRRTSTVLVVVSRARPAPGWTAARAMAGGRGPTEEDRRRGARDPATSPALHVEGRLAGPDGAAARAASRGRALAPPTAGFSASRAAGETLFTCRGAALCFRPYHVYFARRRSADGIAARRDDPPETAVEVDVVALDLAGSLVLVEVERPPVVGDLERAVVAPDRPK